MVHAFTAFMLFLHYVLIGSGQASWYSRESSGSTTASGRPMIDSQPICAMRYVALGTRILIRNTDNGRTARCTVWDRGPYSGGRILDVSPLVRDELKFSGIANVRVYAEN